MASSFIFYLLGIADVDILFDNLGQTIKWLICMENNTPYILDRREYQIEAGRLPNFHFSVQQGRPRLFQGSIINDFKQTNKQMDHH